MANEIYVSYITGKTMTIQLYNGSSTVGAAFSATEIGTTGQYVATMPSGVAFGLYFLVALVSAVVVATGQIMWDGNEEINLGLGLVQGLDKANPATTTPTSLNAGTVSITISGDGVTETVFTRN